MVAPTALEAAVDAVDEAVAELSRLLAERALAGESVASVLEFAVWAEGARNGGP